jgi:hypothetical protein
VAIIDQPLVHLAGQLKILARMADEHPRHRISPTSRHNKVGRQYCFRDSQSHPHPIGRDRRPVWWAARHRVAHIPPMTVTADGRGRTFAGRLNLIASPT